MHLMKLSDPIAAAGATGWVWKVGSVVMGWFLSLIAPVQPFLMAIWILVAADIATGIWAARSQGVRITSQAMGKTVPKIMLYPLAILISQLMVGTFFANTPVIESLTYMVALFICSVEFQSNIENIGKVTGIDIWKQVRAYIQNRNKS